MFRYGSSALHLTAAFNNPSAAAVLLDNGAVVDLGDFRLRTPLHFAAMHESLEATSVLLAAGADRHAVDDDGLEPHEMVPAGSDDGRAGRAGKGEAAAVRRAAIRRLLGAPARTIHAAIDTGDAAKALRAVEGAVKDRATETLDARDGGGGGGGGGGGSGRRGRRRSSARRRSSWKIARGGPRG